MIEEINIGKSVICDGCNADGDEQFPDGTPAQMGGGVIGSYALCQSCFAKRAPAERLERPSSQVYSFDPGKTFGDNVRELRKREYGDENGIIQILSGDDAWKIFNPKPSKGAFE
jgi:hypothetical protein